MDEISKGFVDGERIAKLSTYTLIVIGLVEIGVGQLTGSLGLTADGADSLSDALITLIVWFGLRFSRRSPDETFHFGYLKLENLTAFLASFAMFVVASVLVYYSYLRLISPSPLTLGWIALVTLLGAGAVSLYRAIQMRRIAKRFNILSLKTVANNSIKDASASFVVFAAVLLASEGLIFLDAIGSLIIAAFIYSVAYVSMREASLVLLDAFNRPELADEVRRVIEGKYPVRVTRVRLRRAGPYIIASINVLADGSMTLTQVNELRKRIRTDLRARIEGLILSLMFYPDNNRTSGGALIKPVEPT